MNDRSIGIPNIPDWPSRKIGEVCQLISRGFAPAYVDYSPIRVIGQRCVQNYVFDASAARFHDIRISRFMRAKNGDVLLNSTGTGTIGRSCVFRPEGGDYIVDGHVTVLRPSLSVDSRWLNSLLRSPRGQRHLESYCYTGSTNQIELSRSELVKMEIPIPPIRDQRRIAQILDSVDTDISASRRVIRKLELVSSALISEHLNSIVTATPDVMQLSSVTQVLSGVTLGSEPSGSGSVEVPYLRVANVQDGYVDTTEMKTIRVLRSELPKYLLREGDVLLTEGGDLDKLGRGTMWDARIPECICQNHIFRVRCNEAVVLPAYLALYIGSPIGKSYFLKIAKQTTNLASINSTQLKQMPLSIPSLEDQTSLIELMASSKARLGTERQRLTQLRKLKQGLMDDLLTARVPAPAG